MLPILLLQAGSCSTKFCWTTQAVLACSCHRAPTNPKTNPRTVNETSFPRLFHAFTRNVTGPTVIDIRARKIEQGSTSCAALHRGIGHRKSANVTYKKFLSLPPRKPLIVNEHGFSKYERWILYDRRLTVPCTLSIKLQQPVRPFNYSVCIRYYFPRLPFVECEIPETRVL